MDEKEITKEKLKETMTEELQSNSVLQNALEQMDEKEKGQIINSIEQITDLFSSFALSLSKLNIEQK